MVCSLPRLTHPNLHGSWIDMFSPSTSQIKLPASSSFPVFPDSDSSSVPKAFGPMILWNHYIHPHFDSTGRTRLVWRETYAKRFTSRFDSPHTCETNTHHISPYKRPVGTWCVPRVPSSSLKWTWKPHGFPLKKDDAIPSSFWQGNGSELDSVAGDHSMFQAYDIFPCLIYLQYLNKLVLVESPCFSRGSKENKSRLVLSSDLHLHQTKWSATGHCLHHCLPALLAN